MAKEQPERRSETVQVNITPRERQQLERVAQRDRLSLSDAGRQAILRDLVASGVANHPVRRGRDES